MVCMVNTFYIEDKNVLRVIIRLSRQGSLDLKTTLRSAWLPDSMQICILIWRPIDVLRVGEGQCSPKSLMAVLYANAINQPIAQQSAKSLVHQLAAIDS